MEIKLSDWYDENYDMCSNTTQAVLNIHGIKIPLCDNCIKELKSILDEFLETYKLNT